MSRAFGDELHVFRSSDAESIQTGEGQYSAILRALESATLVVALLSSESARRPWVAFEAGYALGKRAKLHPLLVRGARPHDVPSPFSEMLVRPVTVEEIQKILDALHECTGIQPREMDLADFINELRKVEQQIPDVRLELEPYLDKEKSMLCFRLWYEGHAPLTLQTVVAGIPWWTKDPSWPPQSVPGHLQIERKMVDGLDYIFKEYTASLSAPSASSGGHGFKALKPILHSSKEPQDILWELRFALNRNEEIFTDKNLIRCWIEATSFKSPEQKIPMSRLKPL